MTWRDYDMIESKMKAKMRLWTHGWEGHMVLKGNERIIVAKRV